MPGIKEKQVHDEDQSNQLCKESVGERHFTLDFLHLPIRHLIGERLEYPSLVNFIANTPRLHPSVGGCLSPPVGGDLVSYLIMWLRNASVTASVRLATPNLERILLTWDLIVDELTVSLPAIWVLFNPSTMRVRTSSSRSVRSSRGADGSSQFICRDILEQIADRSGFQGVLHQVSLFKRGQRNHLHLWKLLSDEAGCRCSIHIGHDHIHQNYIRQHLSTELDGGCAAFGFTCQLQVIKNF